MTLCSRAIKRMKARIAVLQAQPFLQCPAVCRVAIRVRARVVPIVSLAALVASRRAARTSPGRSRRTTRVPIPPRVRILVPIAVPVPPRVARPLTLLRPRAPFPITLAVPIVPLALPRAIAVSIRRCRSVPINPVHLHLHARAPVPPRVVRVPPVLAPVVCARRGIGAAVLVHLRLLRERGRQALRLRRWRGRLWLGQTRPFVRTGLSRGWLLRVVPVPGTLGIWRSVVGGVRGMGVRVGLARVVYLARVGQNGVVRLVELRPVQ